MRLTIKYLQDKLEREKEQSKGFEELYYKEKKLREDEKRKSEERRWTEKRVTDNYRRGKYEGVVIALNIMNLGDDYRKSIMDEINKKEPN